MNETNTASDINPEPDEGSYWPSVLLVGGIFGFAGFLINLIFGYMQISSEPTGSFLSPMMLSGIVVCLATCVAGLVAVWHYTKDVTNRIKLGRGALIGFLTGAFLILFSTILNELWYMIDPDYTEKILESVIANVEAMDVPAETRDQMVDQWAAAIQDTNFAQQVLFGIPVTGLLNMLTGMLGVKIFGAKEEESF